jgi:hypothetical protein
MERTRKKLAFNGESVYSRMLKMAFLWKAWNAEFFCVLRKNFEW